MPATPGSPLEPLRPGRGIDRRHWLLAGLLGIVGGALLLDGVLRAASFFTNSQLPIEAFLTPVGGGLLGLVGIAVAFSLAPGGGARRVLGVLVVLLGVGAALGFGVALFTGGLRMPTELRWVVSPQSLLVGAGIVGWLLAAGARWWAFLVVLLAPAVAAVSMGLALAGSSLAGLASSVVALVLATLALALSTPRRR